MIEAKLWVITYEHLDGGSFNVYHVGIDMDEKTAEHLVVEDLKDTVDEEFREEATIDSFEIGQIWFEAVPDVIDNFNVILTEVE